MKFGADVELRSLIRAQSVTVHVEFDEGFARTVFRQRVLLKKMSWKAVKPLCSCS